MLREVALNTVFFTTAEGRVRENDIHSVRGSIADVGSRKRVVVPHKTRILDSVKKHVCHTQHVWKLFLLNGSKPSLHQLLLLHFLNVSLSHVAKRRGEKSSCAASRVEQDLSGLRVNAIHHERGD